MYINTNSQKNRALLNSHAIFCFSLFQQQFNFVGLTLFSLALRRTASLQATAASVSANILASGMLGWAIYSETLYARWWLGVACLTIGTALVQTRTDAKITEQGIEEEEDYYQRTRQQPKVRHRR